jgi:hypothetical protein
MVVTIRLFPGIHDALIDELTKASRRRRSLRAAYLMTVGLTHELTRSSAGASSALPHLPRQAQARDALQDDRAFVTSVLAFGAEAS